MVPDRWSTTTRALRCGSTGMFSIRVEALTGAARVRDVEPGPDAPFRNVAVGERIPVGTELATSSEGRAALRLASGHSVRLDTATRVRWLSHDSFALESGAVYVDSGAEV